MSTTPRPICDPVASAIEHLLRTLTDKGKGPLSKTEGDGQVQLSFGGLAVKAVTYEIALVRLATQMVDEPEYQSAAIAALRGVAHSDRNN